MRLLVTGASGLLGTPLTHLAVESGLEVLSGYRVHQPRVGAPVKLDLEEPEKLRETIIGLRPGAIIHAAAMTEVDRCEDDPDLAATVNGVATGAIAEAARKIDSYLLYVSTDYVFDGSRGDYREEDSTGPVNTYGKTKLLGEKLVAESSVRHCITRTSALFGWGREFRPNFGNRVVNKLQAREPVEVVTDQVASPTLDSNLAEMLLEAATRRYDGILHLAGATPATRFDFAVEIAKTFRLDVDLIRRVGSDRIGWKAKRPPNSSLNVRKAIGLLQRKPLKLEEAMNRFRADQPK